MINDILSYFRQEVNLFINQTFIRNNNNYRHFQNFNFNNYNLHNQLIDLIDQINTIANNIYNCWSFIEIMFTILCSLAILGLSHIMIRHLIRVYTNDAYNALNRNINNAFVNFRNRVRNSNVRWFYYILFYKCYKFSLKRNIW